MDLGRILREASSELDLHGHDSSSIKWLQTDSVLLEITGKWPTRHAFEPGEAEPRVEVLRTAFDQLSTCSEAPVVRELGQLAAIVQAAIIEGPWPPKRDAE